MREWGERKKDCERNSKQDKSESIFIKNENNTAEKWCEVNEKIKGKIEKRNKFNTKVNLEKCMVVICLHGKSKMIYLPLSISRYTIHIYMNVCLYRIYYRFSFFSLFIRLLYEISMRRFLCLTEILCKHIEVFWTLDKHNTQERHRMSLKWKNSLFYTFFSSIVRQ